MKYDHEYYKYYRIQKTMYYSLNASTELPFKFEGTI